MSEPSDDGFEAWLRRYTAVAAGPYIEDDLFAAWSAGAAAERARHDICRNCAYARWRHSPIEGGLLRCVDHADDAVRPDEFDPDTEYGPCPSR